MTTHPHRNHYAICLLAKRSSSISSLNEFFQYGVVLQINNVEHLPDIHHSVVQATGLFRLWINHLTVNTEYYYTEKITRFEQIIGTNKK
jgi:hypothetical protein